MPTKPVALALASLMLIAPGARADESAARSRLEQRTAERGPIRQQLEAALAVPATAIAAEVAEDARGQARRASGAWNAPRIHPLVWVAIGLACVYAALREWGRGWSNL
jgi:hypothetical protein